MFIINIMNNSMLIIVIIIIVYLSERKQLLNNQTFDRLDLFVGRDGYGIPC